MNKGNGPHRLTFSQREGKAPLPEPMRLEHLSKYFRNSVWLHVGETIKKSSRYDSMRGLVTGYQNSEVGNLIQLYFFDIVGMPHDGIDHVPKEHEKRLRITILEEEYHSVLSFIEFILRAPVRHDVLITLKKELTELFEHTPVAYAVQTMQGLPTIVPRISPESGAATTHAIETVEEKGPEGAKAHLRKSVERLNAKHYADSVRESISAVESVARTIDCKANKKLGPALDSLQEAGVLRHKAFKGALNKLYGYTSDEKGIRHPLLDEGAADVDLDDAVFMFSACAAFSAYLLNRHRQIT